MTNGDQGREQRKTFVQTLSESITGQGLVGSIVFLVALGGVAWLIQGVFHNSNNLSLPVLALSSVLLMLGALLVFTTLIHLIDLSDAKSALGLPEGSVRALLALALVGLFAIMASSVLIGSPPREVKGVLAADIDVVLKANPNEHDIFWVPETKAQGGAQTFTATFGSATHIDDFGKQMLTLVGTLMTAVISFYFGSATASQTTGTDGGRGASDANALAKPTAISPDKATKDTPQTYTVTGTNLGSVTKAEAVPTGGGSAVAATNLRATDTATTFELSLSTGTWTLQIASGTASPIPVPGTITVT
jgi:uncharacterized protein (UPF0333 family)